MDLATGTRRSGERLARPGIQVAYRRWCRCRRGRVPRSALRRGVRRGVWRLRRFRCRGRGCCHGGDRRDRRDGRCGRGGAIPRRPLGRRALDPAAAAPRDRTCERRARAIGSDLPAETGRRWGPEGSEVTVMWLAIATLALAQSSPFSAGLPPTDARIRLTMAGAERRVVGTFVGADETVLRVRRSPDTVVVY